MIYRFDGAPVEPIKGIAAGDVPAVDARWTWAARRTWRGIPWVVERLDLSTGRRSLRPRSARRWGLRLSVFAISRDAKYYVHTYSRLLSDLLVVTGLK